MVMRIFYLTATESLPIFCSDATFTRVR